MPIYDYMCLRPKCRYVFTMFYKTHDEVNREEHDFKCPQCGMKKKERLVSKGTSHSLKGKCWAKDGYSK